MREEKKYDGMITKIKEESEEIAKLKKKYHIVLIFAIVFFVEVLSRFLIAGSFSLATAQEGYGIMEIILVNAGLGAIGVVVMGASYLGLIITGLWALSLNGKIKNLKKEQ